MKFTMHSEFVKIYSLGAIFIFVDVFGWSFIYFYLYRERGFDFGQILVYYTLTCFVISALMLSIRNYRRSAFLKTSFLLRAAVYVMMPFITTPVQLYALPIIHAISLIMFFIPFNIRYLELTVPGDRALKSTMQFALWAIFGATVPSLTGAVVEYYGYTPMFLISAVILIFGFVLSTTIKNNETIKINIVEAVKKFKRLSPLIIFEGVWISITGVTIPLVTVLLIQEKISYGLFLSYLGVFGGFSSMIIGGISDRVRKRALFIQVISILLGLSALLVAFSGSFVEWMIFTALISMLTYMLLPFTYALVGDMYANNLGEGVVARDLFLGFGRALGGCVMLIGFLLYNDVKATLIVAGAVLLAYPFIVLLAKVN